jgi:16S rRNA (adenine1518-N6/adenine1519-N6)-dimethyltransferase
MGAGETPFEDPRVLLKRYGLRAKRSWGQNFLVSERAVRIIAEACVDEPGRLVVEIGAGLGTLTRALLERGGRVIAVERDREMCAVLRSELSGHDRFTLEEADAKGFDYAGALGDGVGVVTGNLPYQLTGPLLRRVIDLAPAMARAVLMVQEEVGDRLSATPGQRARGALSVIAQSRMVVSRILKLSPGAFHPRPKVRSDVVALTPRRDAVFDDALTPELFDRVVKAAFSSRRKTLRNALVVGGLGPPADVDALLERAGVDPSGRPQQLEEADFEAIARGL